MTKEELKAIREIKDKEFLDEIKKALPMSVNKLKRKYNKWIKAGRPLVGSFETFKGVK